MPPQATITEDRPQPDLARHFHVRPILIIGLVLALALIVAALTYFKNFVPEMSPVADTPKEDTFPGGTVYLSLAPLNESGERDPIGIFTYDLATDVLMPFLPSTDDAGYMTSEFSPDGSSMAVSIIGHEDGRARLFVGDADASNLEQIPGDEDNGIARSPSWSKDGTTLVYAARPDTEGGAILPEEWEVWKYVRGETMSTFVTFGANPVFLPDGSIAVIKNDGIHRVDLAGGSTRIVPIANAALTIKFDISRDGSLMVIGRPDLGTTDIVKVSSWQPYAAETINTIPRAVFWPTISPDGKHVVAQEFEPEEQDGEIVAVHPKLVGYSIESNIYRIIADLDAFDQQAMFITDWK